MDRAQLFTTLSALVPGDFEKLLFAANPPRGLVPGPSAAQAMRVSALLDWAESPTGRGLDKIQDLLGQFSPLPLPPKLCPHNLPRSGTETFVGREEDLDRVHAQLSETRRLAITALKGMGGIGKTELALQYGLHHLDEGTYPGGICWLLAKDQNIGTEIVNFARTRLNVTPPDGLDLAAQVAYVWSQWPNPVGAQGVGAQGVGAQGVGAHRCAPVLVIIDDVAGRNENDAYGAIKPYLPPPNSRFRVLLTTRLQLGASIRTVEIDILSEAAALKLLASLIGQDRLNQQLDTAKTLCHWLGYLPLGLELVGRFLKTKPTWSLAKMQEQLTAKRLEAKALLRRQADMTAAHESLAAAFELSWQDLTPPAQDLAYRLSLFALAPIPWAWLEEWYDGTDPDDLEDWRDEELISRSLLDLDAAANTVQLHQMIREFFLAKLDQWEGAEALKRDYGKAMVGIAQRIPQTPTREEIITVTPAIPHLAEAATTWQQWLEDENESLIWPFIGLGCFYKGQGAYEQAKPWFVDCLAVARDRLGNDHHTVATSLNNLALLHNAQGRYSEAEPLYREALGRRKQILGAAHPHVANSLNNLAELCRSQGRYREAELLLQEALGLRKQLLGEAHPDVAISLNNLAALYKSQGRYREAEPLFQEALMLMKQLLGEVHPHIATSLNNLAALYEAQGRYSEAELLFQEVLALRKQLLGEAHPDIAASLNNLALLHNAQGRYSEAEPLFQESLALRRQILGEAHPDVASSLNNLALLYEAQGYYRKAEPLFQEALVLMKHLLGEAHPDVATSLNNLAALYEAQGRYSEAESLFQESLSLMKQLLGETHPDVVSSLNNLAYLYQVQGHYSKAEPLFQEALGLKRKLLGEAHPAVASSLNNLALLYQAQGRYGEAEPLYVQALTIAVQRLGENHPNTQIFRNNFIGLLQAVVAANQTHLLSNHPTTQALLGQICSQ